MSRSVWLALALALLVLATPAGPWLLSQLLTCLAPAWGWRLHIGQASGALLGRISLSHLKATSPADSLELELEQFSFSPWQYAVELRRPVVRLRLSGTPATAAPDTAGVRLPVEYFPQLALNGGSLWLLQPADSLEFRLEGLDARYQAAGDTTGELSLEVARLLVVQGGQEQAQGELGAKLHLEPSLIDLRDFQADLRAKALQAQLQGSGTLHLTGELPAAVRLSARLQADSLQASAQLGVRGALRPLDLQLELGGAATDSSWGALSLGARGTVDSARAVVDSLWIVAAGGLAQGRLTYYLAADSLDGQVELAHLDLSRISHLKGQVDAALRAGANLKSPNYAGQLEVWVRRLEALPGEPLDLHLNSVLEPDHRLSAALRSKLGEVLATGQVDPAGTYDLKLAGKLNPSSLLGRPVAPIRLEGQAQPAEVQMRLEMAHLPLEGAQLGPLRAELSLKAGRYLEATLHLAAARLRLRADLQESRLDTLIGAIAPLELERLDPVLGGTLQGRVRASGGLDLTALQLIGDFSLQDLACSGWQAGDLDLDLEYRDQAARLLLAGQDLRAAVSLDARAHFAGQVELDQAVFSRAPADRVALSGALRFAGDLEHLKNTEASAVVSHLALRQGDWELHSADTLKALYRDQRLTLEPWTLQTPAGLLHLAGSARPDSLDLQGQIPSVEWRDLAPQLAGEGYLRFALSGTFERPRLRAEAQLRQVELAGQPLGEVQARLELADSLALEAALEQDRDPAPELELRLVLPTAPLLSGVADTSAGEARLSVKARQADLRALLSSVLADTIGGQLGLEGEMHLPIGLLTDPTRWHRLEGQVVFDQFQVETPHLRLRLPQEAPAAIRLAGDHLAVEGLDLLLEIPDPESGQPARAGELSVRGELAAEVPSDLELKVEDLDLRVLEQLGQGVDLPAGVARLQAQLRGTLNAPVLGAQLNISLEDLGEILGRFRGADQGGDLEMEWIALTGDTLQVSARLPWDLRRGTAAWEQGTLRARSSGFSLLPLLDQLPELENLAGTLSLELAVDGFAGNAQIDGWIDVADLELTVLDVKPGYFFPEGRLEFAGRRGEFKKFAGRPLRGDGRIELSGFVELKTLDSLAYDLRLRAEALPLNYFDLFVAPGMDLSASLSNTATGSLFRCEARLDHTRAEVPLIDLNAPPVPPPPATVKDPFLENMELEVSVDVRDLRVENELADLRLEGLSRIYGTFYKPQFQGGLEILDGKVFVLNREFEFQKGRISLDRPTPTYSILDLAYEPLLFNPDLDLEATTTVRPHEENQDYQVTLKLQGPALQVVPLFTSVPPVPDLQLLGLLAFGSLSPPSQEEYTGALYTAAGQLLLSRQVKKIGLDEFQILPSGTVLGTVGYPSVRLGKYFKFPLPLRVGYEASTQEPSWGEFRVEHKFGSYLTLTGEAQSKYERYGLGLGLKKDF